MYNVLVCDDDKAILDSIEIYLNNEGYKVYRATNGVEALAVAENTELHCIIMDIMMPGMDASFHRVISNQASSKQECANHHAICQV